MEKKETIGNVTAGAMIATAIVVDGLQFLLTLTLVGSVVATFITFAAGFGFWLWFVMLGVKYSGKEGGKKILIGLASMITEIVPFVNALPATTLGVVGIIVQSRIEDAKKVGAPADPRKLVAIARLARMKAARSEMLEAGRIAREARRDGRGESEE